jgi:hypothetical protein
MQKRIPNEGTIDVLESISYTLDYVRTWNVYHPRESAKVALNCTSGCVYCKDITSIRVLNALLYLEISKKICNISLDMDK